MYGAYQSCAVIGESTSLYTGPRLYASEIDAHDAVIRLPVPEGMPWYRNRHGAFKCVMRAHFHRYMYRVVYRYFDSRSV